VSRLLDARPRQVEDTGPVDEGPDDVNPLVFMLLPVLGMLLIALPWLVVALAVGGSLLWLPLAALLGAGGLGLMVLLARPVTTAPVPGEPDEPHRQG
jgi:apolipoprotein N-acyltransferase